MRFVACFLLALTFGAACADEFNGVIYQKPAGWEDAVQSGAKVFAPKDLKAGEILAIIMTGAVPSKGSDMETEFAETIRLANEGGKASDASKISSREMSGVTLLVQTLKLDLAPLGKHDRLYAQVSQGSQRVFVTVVMNKESLVDRYGVAVSDFLSKLAFKTAPAVTPGASPTPGSTAAKGKIPTGNTPDFYPGVVGWLPSGHGVPIPPPALVGGKPVGMWWKAQYDPVTFNTRPVLHIYLADGTRASNPRLGGGMLFDIEGQRAQRGNTGLGTFSVSGGQMMERFDGFESKGAFSSGAGADGKFFKMGGAKFYPLIPLTNQTIAGHWKGPGVDYKFKPDGTYESGMTHANGDWAVANFQRGTYILDGYLIMFKPDAGPSTVSIIGASGGMLATNSGLFFKK